MSRKFAWIEYKQLPDEGLLRVVAAGYESLLQSRPKMTREWILSTRGGTGYRTGGVSVEFMYDGSLYRWTAHLRFQRSRAHLLRLSRITDPLRWELTTIDGDRWSNVVISQSEAECLAASAFTGGHPVQNVSNVAIDKARRDISFAEGVR